MSKEKIKESAVSGNVSLEAVNKTEEVVNQDIEPGLVDFAKDMIIKFAKEYRRNPQCPAQVLLELVDDYRVECDANKAQKNISDKDIIADAGRLFDIGTELTEDFSKHHDHANEEIKSIMRTHAPTLQKAFDKYESMLLEENSEPKE